MIVTVLRLLYYRKLKKAVAAGTMTEEEAATLRKRGWRMWLAEERTKLQAKRAAAHEAKEAKRAAETETEAAAAAAQAQTDPTPDTAADDSAPADETAAPEETPADEAQSDDAGTPQHP